MTVKVKSDKKRTNISEIKRIVKKNNGIITAKEVSSAGIDSWYLTSMVKIMIWKELRAVCILIAIQIIMMNFIFSSFVIKLAYVLTKLPCICIILQIACRL